MCIRDRFWKIGWVHPTSGNSPSGHESSAVVVAFFPSLHESRGFELNSATEFLIHIVLMVETGRCLPNDRSSSRQLVLSKPRKVLCGREFQARQAFALLTW